MYEFVIVIFKFQVIKLKLRKGKWILQVLKLTHGETNTWSPVYQTPKPHYPHEYPFITIIVITVIMAITSHWREQEAEVRSSSFALGRSVINPNLLCWASHLSLSVSRHRGGERGWKQRKAPSCQARPGSSWIPGRCRNASIYVQVESDCKRLIRSRKKICFYFSSCCFWCIFSTPNH